MQVETLLTDDQVLQQLGERLARYRLTRNLTQEQVAVQAGLGLRTVQRLELGAAGTQLSGFIRICRVLGLLDRLGNLVPDAGPSPMAQLRRQGRPRGRASGRPTATSPAAPKPWSWGDAP
jgi:transcriptional regulator with XRE-family HTH domain